MIISLIFLHCMYMLWVRADSFHCFISMYRGTWLGHISRTMRIETKRVVCTYQFLQASDIERHIQAQQQAVTKQFDPHILLSVEVTATLFDQLPYYSYQGNYHSSPSFRQWMRFTWLHTLPWDCKSVFTSMVRWFQYFFC